MVTLELVLLVRFTEYDVKKKRNNKLRRGGFNNNFNAFLYYSEGCVYSKTFYGTESKLAFGSWCAVVGVYRCSEFNYPINEL